MKIGFARRQKEKLPKIKNPFLYAYGLFAKLLASLFFLILSLVLSASLLLARLLFRRKALLKKVSCALISGFCRIFTLLLRAIFFIKLRVTDEDRKKLKSLKSGIVVANHPSVLDLPILLSLVPAVSLVIPPKPRFPLSLMKDAYTEAGSWDALLFGAKDTLTAGGNIIIFPERHLTPRSGTNPYRRTAARLARECASPIQPLYIGGSDKHGLGSPAAPLAYCRTGLYVYEIKMLPAIPLDGYAEMKSREASVAVTKKIHDEISAEAYLSDYRIV
ncbi:MAG: 1-acyl-sn-glycerol-3-phosphate acyltransferase [Treponema sp.]|nr:1-acyl-sn-glycerol-3-phosphate acyltransferase [Treponema sp.]